MPDPRFDPDPAGARRPPLRRRAIVDAAVAIADAEGIDAVSMPRLARTLGVAPMSLYRHVPHKDALVDLMLDAAVGAPPDLAVAASWRAALERWARANRQVFVLHPWTLPLVSGTRRMGPAECAWAEALLAAGVSAGLAPHAALAVLHVVNSYVRGASAPLGERGPDPEDLRRAAAYPILLGLLEAAPAAGGDGFAAGLDRVLDGVTSVSRV